MLNGLCMYLALGFDTGIRGNGHHTADSNQSVNIISILSSISLSKSRYY